MILKTQETLGQDDFERQSCGSYANALIAPHIVIEIQLVDGEVNFINVVSCEPPLGPPPFVNGGVDWRAIAQKHVVVPKKFKCRIPGVITTWDHVNKVIKYAREAKKTKRWHYAAQNP